MLLKEMSTATHGERSARTKQVFLILGLVVLLAPSAAIGAPCVAPDSGGTASLPDLACGLETRDGPFQIVNGLPPATTIDIEIVELNLVCSNPISCSLPVPPGLCEAPGGTLGGTGQCYSSALQMEMTGTGLLAGFFRTIFVPVDDEIHAAPRNPGDPIQAFPTDFFQLQGQLFGDPDFDFLFIQWGAAHGLPSPGATTLTQLPGGDWNVDSFFDITYQIDFQGAPGSFLEGFAGTTQGSGKLSLGETIAAPTPVPASPVPWIALLGASLLATAGVWMVRRV